jgi:hypothetical protein
MRRSLSLHLIVKAAPRTQSAAQRGREFQSRSFNGCDRRFFPEKSIGPSRESFAG